MLGPSTTWTDFDLACMATSLPNSLMRLVFHVEARQVELGKQAVPVSSRCDWEPRTPLIESLTYIYMMLADRALSRLGVVLEC